MILPIEKQVCSLEIAKRMEELGFAQDSERAWINVPEGLPCTGIKSYEPGWMLSSNSKVDFEKVAAYSCAETGAMLPKKAYTWFGGTYWISEYEYPNKKEEASFGTGYSHYSENSDTEVNARCKMLIYLKEQNLI